MFVKFVGLYKKSPHASVDVMFEQ